MFLFTTQFIWVGHSALGQQTKRKSNPNANLSLYGPLVDSDGEYFTIVFKNTGQGSVLIDGRLQYGISILFYGDNEVGLFPEEDCQQMDTSLSLLELAPGWSLERKVYFSKEEVISHELIWSNFGHQSEWCEKGKTPSCTSINRIEVEYDLGATF